MVIVSKVYDSLTDPLTREYLAHLQELLASEYNNTDAASFIPRLFRVIEISEDNATIKLNFHLSDTGKENKINFGILQNISSNNLKEFKYEAFLSAYCCIGFQLSTDSKRVTWPSVTIGEVLESAREGYCIDSTGAIVHMRCEGMHIISCCFVFFYF